MNPRAIQLVGRARDLIATVPGATSFQCNDSRTWTIITVRASDDETVYQLALLYGLGEVKERRAERSGGGYRWYLRAGSERTLRGRGSIRLDIVGPAHIEAPKGEGV